jgi:hypothetical protein
MDDLANNVSDEQWASLVEDTGTLLRDFPGRKGKPAAVCLDSRTLQSAARIPNLALISHPFML